MKKEALFCVGSVILALMLIIVAAFTLGESHYDSFKSPSGEYELVVLVRNGIGFGSPGGGGDRPGVVVLKNAQGETLDKASVEMVSLVHDPIWEKDRVSVRLVFEFDLE
jgi:hypothetical protein